ncbi:MerR family transcriptional regulator [Rhodococcus sp. IEGM 1305]|uniref:MerR family transcriptional regulator n=1 Tax=Rhodococcus sp. IEGM 1305 TaxID=3047092 RepID=UPI0024B848C7|nr:MerR family transcriptional regulator [Rhodococcus sp. IEGM 1305]MDI9949608.1 MerR family transcriptional regulator [Rhodococcus sp. IEGM 1305]
MLVDCRRSRAEEYGLITPLRTGAGTRRYGDHELARLERVAELIDAGVNVVGIGRVLDREHRTGELERDNRRLAADNAQPRAEQAPATETDTDATHLGADPDQPASPASETTRSNHPRRQAGQRPRRWETSPQARATGKRGHH